MKFAFLIVLSSFTFLISNAQKQPTEKEPFQIGARCPIFELKEIEYFSSKKARLSDFSGKWLVLDFWNEYCSACIASFPKINQLQKDFQGQVQFVLVGDIRSNVSNNNGGARVRNLYERCRKVQNLNLAVAYDSSLFQRLNISTCPYVVIIDQNSVVRGISYSINKTSLECYISAKDTVMNRSDASVQGQSRRSFFRIDNNLGKTLFQSQLSMCDESSTLTPQSIDTIRDGKLSLYKIDLASLYRFAFVGKSTWAFGDSLYTRFNLKPIIETFDSTLFQVDYRSGKNLFCYSLDVPALIDNGRILEIIQGDLFSYFHHKIRIEERKMPYWKLVGKADASEKLKSKTDSIFFKSWNSEGFTAKNYSITDVLRQIWAFNQSEPPFIDETNILNNVDITLNCLMTDLNDVNRALEQYGLSLIKSEKIMKVLVVCNNN